jgi:hypothetical protein
MAGNPAGAVLCQTDCRTRNLEEKGGQSCCASMAHTAIYTAILQTATLGLGFPFVAQRDVVGARDLERSKKEMPESVSSQYLGTLSLSGGYWGPPAFDLSHQNQNHWHL